MPKLFRQSKKYGTLCIEFDTEDAGVILGRTWTLGASSHTFYARGTNPSTRERECLHRVLMDAAEGEIVDHIDGNGLNNRRDNLRICTVRQNAQNRRVLANTSKYKGVSWDARHKHWVAAIIVNGRRIKLGSFKSEAIAAHMYNRAATRHFGEFARLNDTGLPYGLD